MAYGHENISHELKQCFKAQGVKLCDVARSTGIVYQNLCTFLNGYGCISGEALERLKNFAMTIENVGAGRKKKFRRRE